MRVKCNWCTGWETTYDALRICYDTKEHETVEQKKVYVYAHTIVRGHSSALEHLVLNFKVENLERLILQQFSRHRIASITVESTRYTLKKLLKEDRLVALSKDTIERYFKVPQDCTPEEVDYFVSYLNSAVSFVQFLLSKGETEKAKYALPESYLTKLFWTINARSLRNFLQLRFDKHASPAMEQLANKLIRELPEDIQFLFEDIVDNATTRENIWI